MNLLVDGCHRSYERQTMRCHGMPRAKVRLEDKAHRRPQPKRQSPDRVLEVRWQTR
jgi:hypothetical protein